MKVKYDWEVDILYIRLMDAVIEESDETQPGLVIDYDVTGMVVGFEIMNASKKNGLASHDSAESGLRLVLFDTKPI